MGDLDSRQVSWWDVHVFVQPVLAAAGSWPLVGTPAWCALSDDDPAKVAAVYDAAQRYALRVDTLQAALAEAAHDISASENWTTQARRMVNHEHRIPRRLIA